MADVKFSVVEFALSTAEATNTFDITSSGFGTPKAVIFLYGNNVTAGTAFNYGGAGVGFTDGTRQNAVYFQSDNARAADSQTQRYHTDANCIGYNQTSGVYGLFGFDSWITDGVRLVINDAIGSAYLNTAILIGGSDVDSVYCGMYDDLGTGTGAVDITAPGFEPDLVFMSSIGQNIAAPIGGGAGILSFGIGHNDASDTQRATIFSAVDAAATTVNNAYISNNSIVGQIYNNAVSWTGSIGSYDASGFSITPSASAGSDVIFYLALKFTNSPNISLFDLSIPTTGNYAETTPGFEPDFGLVSLLAGPSSRNTLASSSTFSSAISAFDASSIRTHNVSDRDNVATTFVRTNTYNNLSMTDYTGTTAVVSSGYAFDADGWDFTLSTNPASAVLGWALAIGPGSAPPVGTQNMRIKVGAEWVNATPSIKAGSQWVSVDAYVKVGAAWVPVYEQ